MFLLSTSSKKFIIILCSLSLCKAYSLDKISKEFSAQLAVKQIEKIVSFGPRPSASKSLKDTRKYIKSELEKIGWKVKFQDFEAQTPKGKIKFTNVRARFKGNWKKNRDLLLCSHYDTKLYEKFKFVGAIDGGSSTGLLIELARVIPKKLARKIELVFFDGEESLNEDITNKDGLYGSKFYAQELTKFKDKDLPKFAIVVDMIGDNDLKLQISGTKVSDKTFFEFAAKGLSKKEYLKIEKRAHFLARKILTSSKKIKLRKYISFISKYEIIDDHIPLSLVSKVPAINIIDFDYDYWHTHKDTLDKLNINNVGITGKILVRAINDIFKYL